MADDLYIGPTVLAPGAPKKPDLLARLVLIPVLIVLLGTIGIFYIFFTPVLVVGDSMEPTLHGGDRLLATRSYTTAERGDIISLELQTKDGPDAIIKRVVAIAGDTIEIRDGVLYVNDIPEPTEGRYLEKNGRGEGVTAVVPEGTVFVLGDNRPVSLDSRFVGPIPMKNIDGKFVFRFMPFGRFGRVQ